MFRRLVGDSVAEIESDLAIKDILDIWVGDSSGEYSCRTTLANYAVDALRRSKVTYRSMLSGNAETIANNAHLPIELIILIKKKIAKHENSKHANISKVIPEYHVKTGIQQLDQYLGGRGMKPGTIVEIYGPSGSGKSQICARIISNVASCAEADNLIFIECGTCGVDLRAMKQCLDPDKIRYTCCQTIDKLYRTIELIYQDYKTGVYSINQKSLMIIDCITPLIWASESDETTQEVMKHLIKRLKIISGMICILMTNNAIKDSEMNVYKRALGKRWDIGQQLFIPIKSILQ